jgi:5-methylcytosine-specific restriction protein A
MPSLPPRHTPETFKGRQHKRPTENRQARRALHTGSKRWRAIRAMVLAGEPLCRECIKAGRITGATQVDHIDGDDSNNAGHNLQPLCAPCHSSKTSRENGGFGNG